MYCKAGFATLWLLLLSVAAVTRASPLAQTAQVPSPSTTALAVATGSEFGVSLLSNAISITSSSISSAVASVSLVTLAYVVTEEGALSSLMVGSSTSTINPVSLCIPEGATVGPSGVVAAASTPIWPLATIAEPTGVVTSQSTGATASAGAQQTNESLEPHGDLTEQQESEMESCEYPRVNGYPLLRDAVDSLVLRMGSLQALKARYISQSEYNRRILARQGWIVEILL